MRVGADRGGFREWGGGQRVGGTESGGGAYHVADLGGTTGKDEDDTRAFGCAAGLEIVAGRGELAGFDQGGILDDDDGGGGEGGNEASGGKEVEELHLCSGIGTEGVD